MDRASSGADAPAFVALQLTLRQTQRLSGLRLSGFLVRITNHQPTVTFYTVTYTAYM